MERPKSREEWDSYEPPSPERRKPRSRTKPSQNGTAAAPHNILLDNIVRTDTDSTQNPPWGIKCSNGCYNTELGIMVRNNCTTHTQKLKLF